MLPANGKKKMPALYHNDMSLCTQKVRVALAEKGLAWESRHLVLRAARGGPPAGMVGERHRVADWYRRRKARPSFRDAIVKWENAEYPGLMQRCGAESWTQVHAIMQTL
jgi:glutathione S-transferase